MEDKIQKLFLCLEDSKNEKLFELCISQLSEIYKENFSLGVKILEKNSKLLNSKNWNQRVMGSSILEKTYGYHCEKIQKFLNSEITEENLEDILNDFSHLFYIEKLNQSSQNQPMGKTIKENIKLSSLEEIKNTEHLTPMRIDFEKLIICEKPLYGYDDKVYKEFEKNGSNFDEEQFFENLGNEKHFDLRNFTNLLNLSNNNEKETAIEEEFIPPKPTKSKRKSKKQEKQQTNVEEEIEQKTNQNKRTRKCRGKVSDSPQKKLKNEKNSGFAQNSSLSLNFIESEINSLIKVSIPFNNIFKMALKNLFHPNWEKRHSSCLILKAFLKENYAFLLFFKEIEIEKSRNISKLEILTKIKEELLDFYMNQAETEQKTIDILTRILIIVALDRFGDFLFEKFYLVVRESASQTFGSIITLEKNFDIEKLDMIGNIIFSLLEKKDWQIVQSALYLLKTIIISRPEFKKDIFERFKEIWLILIESNEETQQLVTEIMNCYYEDEWIFQQNLNYIRCFLEKSWQSLNKLDEISYATGGIIEMIINYQMKPEHMVLLYPEGFDYNFYFSKLIRFYHHTLLSVRKYTYNLINSFFDYNVQALNSKNLETLRKIAILSLQNLMIEEQKEIIELLVEMNIRLLNFFYENDKDFVLELIKNLLKNSLMIDVTSLISSFQFFDNFNEISPYKNLSFSSKPQEMLDFHYKRIIIVSNLLGRTFILLNDLNFFLQIFKEIIKNFNENSSNLLLLLSIYSEIIMKDISFLLKFKECSCEYLENIINLEGYDLQRSDIRDLETLIFNNLHTLKVLISNSTKAAQFLSFLNDFLKLSTVEKRKKMEEIYTKLLELNTNEEILNIENLEKNNIENCSKQIIFSINNFVSITKELQSNIKVCAVLIYLQHYVSINKAPEKLNILIRPLLASLNNEKYTFFVEKASLSLFHLTVLFEKKTPSPIPKVLKNVINSLQESKKNEHFKNVKNNENLYFLYSKKAQGVNSFISYLIEKHKEETFNKYACILQTAMSEIDVFDKTYNENNMESTREKTNFQGILQNLRILKALLTDSLSNKYTFSTLDLILNKLIKLLKFFNFLEKTHVPKLEALAEENMSIVENDNQNKHLIYMKIHSKLIKIFKNLILSISSKISIERTNEKITASQYEGFFISIIEKICGLLKEENTLIYELLSGVYCEYEENFVELAPVFIIPILKSLNNKNKKIREFSFKCLGEMINSSLVQDQKYVPKLKFSSKITKHHKKGLEFILDFKNNKNFNYEIQGKLNAELRPYQIEGVKWLAFLSKYNLHGALCDDMGLGKTLQALVVIQSELFKFYEKNPQKTSLSLIVCPPTLTEHWLYEINKYLDQTILKPLIFKPTSFRSESEILANYNLLIISYNNLQKSIDFFNGFNFLFCVVDEGHVLKNSKTKISKSIKCIKADHRFVLTGTPIQNNILELWSIFDFLMPEFLGDEEFFKKHFSKMLQINVMKFSDHSLLFSKEQDKILRDLHHKITPFILRREKIDVLKELPQKIIQDFYCSMTDLQSSLYSELEKNQIASCNEILEIGKKDNEEGNLEQTKSVFELMILLRKLCNHPYQLLNDKTFKNSGAFNKIHNKAMDYENSGKFLALKDLLCELGFDDNNEESNNDDQLMFLTSTNKNKILIFSRFKETLDLIAQTFLDKIFPKIRYLRLDGSVSVDKRFALTKLFNEDSEYKIMLLTTAVGGVGLNLSSANVVVMFDHDYNPMNDLQAIDRAHRIGQKNILNVYRLIMKDTLEEKIMGIQKFKINVANAIINIENSSIKNIKESNILSLFNNVQEIKKDHNNKNVEKNKMETFTPYAKILENLQELWSEAEYKPNK